MPLLKRVVWPPHVSRVPLVEDWVRDENGRVYSALLPATEQPQDLEAFTNLTLANLITQLSSLSRHAEDLFGEMIKESSTILNRTVSLQGRVDKLAVKVKNLDSNVEEVSLQDIHMRKAFKSSTMFDQQVVSRETIPAAMLETYQSCEHPPPLHELNPYRDDGKDGLKFYTDPSYFFNLWREKMHQETEQLKHDKKQRPGKKGESRKKGPIRQPTDTRARHREKAIARGDITDQPIYHPGVNQTNYDQMTVDGRPQRPNSIEVANNYQHSSNNGYPNTYSPNHEVNNVPHGFSPSYNNTYAGQQPYTNNVDASNRKGITHNTSVRPTQPPPAPPSDHSTPTPPSGSRGGTPTRVSRPAQDRGSLPPPPLPPDAHQDLGHHPHAQSPLTLQHGGSQSPAPIRQGMAGMYRPEPNLPPPPPTPDKQPDLDPPPPTPPPPPPLVENNQQPPPPPPPLPPPIMDMDGHGPQANHMNKIIQNGDIRKAASLLKKRPPEEKREEKQPDARSALLEAIRQGIDLRKVDTISKPKEETEASGDVAYILARRMAFELSDSESSSDSDESEWGDDGVTNQGGNKVNAHVS